MADLLPEKEDFILLSLYDLISLKDARVPAGAFAMRPLNEIHVQQLVESDHKSWPVISTTRCAQGYLLIDGYHRWEAAKRKQVERIKATCQPYSSEEEVVEAAFRANLTHGLKTNLQGRGDYAYWLHVTFPDLEQEEIARRAGMTQGGVSKAIVTRDRQAKRLQQHNGEEDPKEQQRVAKLSCRRFTKSTLGFLEDVELFSDEELIQLLSTILKTQEDRDKVARIGRLLSGSPTTTTGPLRLRQFAERPSY